MQITAAKTCSAMVLLLLHDAHESSSLYVSQHSLTAIARSLLFCCCPAAAPPSTILSYAAAVGGHGGAAAAASDPAAAAAAANSCCCFSSCSSPSHLPVVSIIIIPQFMTPGHQGLEHQLNLSMTGLRQTTGRQPGRKGGGGQRGSNIRSSTNSGGVICR